MVAFKGRDVLVKVEDATTANTFNLLGGMRSPRLSINNETVDITSADDAGVRTLLDGAGVNSISISGAGVAIDDTAATDLETYARGNIQKKFQFVFGAVGTYEGTFVCTSFEYTGEYNGEAQYSASFESSGAVTFT